MSTSPTAQPDDAAGKNPDFAPDEAPQPAIPGPNIPVYGEFFGLTEAPFNLTPDPRFLFLTDAMREALSNLRYGLSQSRGLTVLLGDAGTGKTTLVRSALDELPRETNRCVLVSNPALNRAEFYEFLTAQFGFSAMAATSKTRFLAELTDDLCRRAVTGVTGLIVDEAQSMPYELLEEIRLLGNIETTNRKLLNIVLSGQPELADRLNEPGLRQLKQRVALRCELTPLSQPEASAYIAGRIRIAGGRPDQIFTAEAITAIHRGSSGIPRSINVICDNALLSSFALQRKPVRAEIITDVCRDFDFVDPVVPHPPSPARNLVAQPGGLVPQPKREKKKHSFFS